MLDRIVAARLAKRAVINGHSYYTVWSWGQRAQQVTLDWLDEVFPTVPRLLTEQGLTASTEFRRASDSAGPGSSQDKD